MGNNKILLEYSKLAIAKLYDTDIQSLNTLISQNAMDPNQLKNNADQAATLLKQLSNPNRLWILCQLVEGELSVGQIHQRVELSQSALSQHLAKLRKDELVSTRREGNSIYYTLKSREVQHLLETLHKLYCEA